jgi:hypothetical protein
VRRRLLAAVVALAACDAYAFAWDSSTGTLVVGFVNNGTTVVIEAADTVQAGAAFTVTVNTFGSSSCVRAERLDVEVTDLVARLTPYDLVAPATVECTADYGAHPRTAEVTFAERGVGTLEVHGKGAAGDTVVTRTVVVR